MARTPQVLAPTLANHDGTWEAARVVVGSVLCTDDEAGGWELYSSSSGVGTPTKSPSEWAGPISPDSDTTTLGDYGELTPGTFYIARFHSVLGWSPWSNVDQLPGGGGPSAPVLSHTAEKDFAVTQTSGLPTDQWEVQHANNPAGPWFSWGILTSVDNVIPAPESWVYAQARTMDNSGNPSSPWSNVDASATAP